MKKTIIGILFGLSIYSNSIAQIQLGVELISKNQESINIIITTTNTSEQDSILFYTPSKESTCMSIISINFLELKTEKSYDYFPCDAIIDLDHIKLNETNSKLLLPGSSESFSFDLAFNDVTPYLRHESYLLSVNLDYENGNFISTSEYKIYRGSVKSNQIELRN